MSGLPILGPYILDTTLLLALIVIFLTVLLIKWTPKTDIPGPFAFPLIGNYPQLMQTQLVKRVQFLEGLMKKYGKVFRVYFGSHMMVIVCGYDNLYNTFIKNGEVFSDRPSWMPGVKYRQEGLIFQNGEKWKKTRRFTMQSMRDLGVGRKSLEEVIQDEICCVDAILEKTKGQAIDVRDIMTAAISNVIHNVVLGTRFSHDDKTFKRMLENFDVIFKGPGPISINTMMPTWIRAMIPSVRRVLERRDEMMRYIRKQIEEHKATYDPNTVRDLLDSFLRQNDCSELFHNSNLTVIILELFSAGTETTSTTLAWALLYLIGYPDVQQKCFNEIEKVVGSGRMVSTADRPQLPYVEATILEIQRMANCTLGTLPHSATKDTTIGGYRVPKGAIVVGFLNSAHFDPKYWDEPRSFKPERFIGNDGKLVKKEQMMPFSLGPRICLGESLAKMDIFLMIASLVQRYTFTKASESDVLDFVGQTGITTRPPPYKLRAIRRS